MTEQNFPPTWAGNGMKPIWAGSVPAVLAAACICDTAQDPSHMVATLPVAIRPFEFSQLVVVGSASVSPPWTTLNSRESIVLSSCPLAHGVLLPARLSLALASQLTEPRAPSHVVSGQPSW